MNYAENCLKKDDNSDAIIFYNEQEDCRRYSWKDLKQKVFQLSHYFVAKKIKPGDRIAAVLPNIPETVISFLSVAKIGAIWSSCSSDFGSKAVIDRFGQINPKILILMGSTAMESLFGSKIKITKERGKWKDIIIDNKNYLCMITFHPAYLLRQPENKKYSWTDLKEIRKKIDELNIIL